MLISTTSSIVELCFLDSRALLTQLSLQRVRSLHRKLRLILTRCLHVLPDKAVMTLDKLLQIKHLLLEIIQNM